MPSRGRSPRHGVRATARGMLDSLSVTEAAWPYVRIGAWRLVARSDPVKLPAWASRSTVPRVAGAKGRPATSRLRPVAARRFSPTWCRPMGDWLLQLFVPKKTSRALRRFKSGGRQPATGVSPGDGPSDIRNVHRISCRAESANGATITTVSQTHWAEPHVDPRPAEPVMARCAIAFSIAVADCESGRRGT